MTTWLFSDSTGRCIAISAAAWFDARAVAYRLLPLGPYAVTEAEDLRCVETTAEPDVVCVWRGTDAGRYPGRRLEVVKR